MLAGWGYWITFLIAIRCTMHNNSSMMLASYSHSAYQVYKGHAYYLHCVCVYGITAEIMQIRTDLFHMKHSQNR